MSTHRGGLLLAAGSTLLAFVAGELSVRLLRPGLVAAPAVAENPFWRHDAGLGWFHRPGQTGAFGREEFSHQVRINGMGFRDRERDLPRSGAAPAASRVAVLGDSFTWGHGVEDAEIFTRLLEERLHGTEVWNLGVSAYSTDQELLLYRRFAPSVRPGVVMVMVSRNDYAGNVSVEYSGYPKPWFVRTGSGWSLTGVPVPGQDLTGRALAWLRGRSAFLNGLWLLGAGEPERSGPAGGWQEQSAVTAYLLDTLAEEARGNGARLAVANVPSIAHVYFPEVLESERRGDAFLAGWAAEAGVPYFDLVPGFRKAWETTGTRLHWHHDKHWNAAGHALAAELLAPRLSALQREAAGSPAPE